MDEPHPDTEGDWEMWDDDPDEPDDSFNEDMCPSCGFNNPSWDGGICFCEICGYIGTGVGA